VGWKVGHLARTRDREGGVVRNLVQADRAEPNADDDPFWADVEWPDGTVTREYTRDLEDGRDAEASP